MTILRMQVDTHVEEHICPECEKQNKKIALRACGDGEPGLDNTLLFPHKCPECGFEVRLPVQYPNFSYLPKEGAEWVEVEGKKRVVVAT